MNEDEEEFIEVDDEDYYEYEDDEFSGSDAFFLIGLVVIGCGVLAFVFKLIKNTFKKVNVKVGNKLELGAETTAKAEETKKDDSNS